MHTSEIIMLGTTVLICPFTHEIWIGLDSKKNYSLLELIY